MADCWAASLGDCGRDISREHLITESLFLNDEIDVEGFSWCKNQPKRIGLANLTSKILCRHHNSILSPVDEAGAKAFSTIREMRRISNVRQKMKPTFWHVVRHSIDGRSLERWFLKTLINLSSQSDHAIGRDSSRSGRPSARLVQIVYGLAEFEGQAGLYLVAHKGMQMHSSERVAFCPMKVQEHIEGGLFLFRGFTFLLFLEENGLPAGLNGVSFNGEDLSRSQLYFRHREAIDKTGIYKSQILTFEW